MRHWVRHLLDDAFWSQASLPEYVRQGLARVTEFIETMDTHAFRTIELEEIAVELIECDNLTELSQILWRAAIETGFQHFVIFALDQSITGIFKNRICTSLRSDWIKQYQLKSYQFVDPIVAEAQVRDGAFLFSDVKSEAPVVERFWEDAEHFGVGRNGLCFALHGSQGVKIGLSLGSIKSALQVAEAVALNGADLEQIAQLAVDRFCQLSLGHCLSKNPLTDHELRFLHVLATDPDYEKAMKIQPGYGSNGTLQAAIRVKLGVSTIFQALALVSAKGWLNAMAYDESEVIKPFLPLIGLDQGEALLFPEVKVDE